VEKVLREIAYLAGEANCHRTKKDGSLKRVTLDGVPVELYVGKPNAWGAQMLFCTGSPLFNIYQRGIATKQHKLLNQYGLYWEATDHKGRKVPGELIARETEEEIFEALGMKYLAPTKRDM
jgi:DNA polymerase (family 10)